MKAVVVVFSYDVSVKRVLKIVLIWVSLFSDSNFSFSDVSVVCSVFKLVALARIASWILIVIKKGISDAHLILL